MIKHPFTGRWAKAAAVALLATAASIALYDTLVSVPAAKAAAAESASVLDLTAVSRAHCSGLKHALPTMAMSQIPWVSKKSTHPESANVPLWPGLGTLTYKITTADPKAQAYFDQGLRLAYGFNHYEAIRSFRKAQAIDPKCAMCFWGEAYALGPDLNLPMQADAVAPAFAAITRAQALAAGTSLVEQALIAAMAKRYAEHPPENRAPLDQAFSDAMAEVAAKFPDDVDVKVIYAEALMDLSPWDYWEAGGTVLHDKQKPLESTLLSAMKLNPKHPGALHYYIHAVEATPHPERAEAAADTLRGMMPDAGHMIHMPGHIYARVGRFKDSIVVNEQAIASDEAYLKAVPERPAFDVYAVGYYPHNVHFVLMSTMLAGDYEEMRAAATKLISLTPEAAQKAAVQVQPIASTPLLVLAHTGDDATVMAAPKPADDLPYMQAMWHYARGLVMARTGKVADAEVELKAIETLSSSGALFKLPQAVLPAELLGDISMEVLRARIAEAKGDMKSAVKHMREAVEDQAQVPYTEPPFWYYPVGQSLGGLLLASGRAKEATDAFRASLLDQPGNAWALYGLMKAYEKLGDKAAAAATKKQFASAWLGKTIDIDVAKM